MLQVQRWSLDNIVLFKESNTKQIQAGYVHDKW